MYNSKFDINSMDTIIILFYQLKNEFFSGV